MRWISCHWSASHVLKLLLLACLSLLSRPLSAAYTVNLPRYTDGNDLLQAWVEPALPSGTVRATGDALGQDNVLPLGKLVRYGQPPTRVTETPYAMWTYHDTLSANAGRWWVGSGQGFREVYQGNRDAGQFWVDLHADGQTQKQYNVSASSASLNATWYGIGYQLPFRVDAQPGTGLLVLRQVTASDMRLRSLTGQASGEDFTAMMRDISAGANGQTVRGQGWAVDLQCRMGQPSRWQGQLTVEGALGAMSWKGVQVEDTYLTSPGVFQDAEGFFRYTGGISGVDHREDFTMRVNPAYRLDLTLGARPVVYLLGAAAQQDDRTTVYAGIGLPRRGWLPYLRVYPTSWRVELGAVAARWQFRLATDTLGFTTQTARQMELAISLTPLRF